MKGDEQQELIELGRAFEWGFFSDGVVRAMKSYKSSGRFPSDDSREKKQLTKAYNFLEMVERGEEQVYSGILQSNAVDSIGAYRRSLSAFYISHHPKGDEFKPKFKSYINNIKDGIDLILNSKDVGPEHAENIEKFFRAISEVTLKETERLMENEEMFLNG